MQSRQPPIRGQVLDARRTPSTGRPQDWLGVPVEVLAEALPDQTGHGLAVGASRHLLVDGTDDGTHLLHGRLCAQLGFRLGDLLVDDRDQLVGAELLRQVAGQEFGFRSLL